MDACVEDWIFAHVQGVLWFGGHMNMEYWIGTTGHAVMTPNVEGVRRMRWEQVTRPSTSGLADGH